MDKNETYLLSLLDKQNYQDAVDFVFGNNNSTKNGRIKFLRSIGEENLLDLFKDREQYLQSLNSSKKKKVSYTKFPALAKFSEEFNLLEDMVVDQALKKRGLSSIDDLMDRMGTCKNDSPFIINHHQAFNNISNFIQNREWNGIERRLKPR